MELVEQRVIDWLSDLKWLVEWVDGWLSECLREPVV